MKKQIRNKTRTETVVVFGGSGFLGSHVADALTEAGFRVRIFDRVSSPFAANGQEMIVGDIRDQQAVDEAVRGCSYVYNFAGLADLDAGKNQPLDTAQLNIIGNLHLLEAARQAHVQRFIYASTIYVYSEKGSFYRVSKQAAERYVEVYQERFGLPYTILRYGSLYGRRANQTNGIFRLLHEALTTGKITYNGSPDSMREYIHVADAARLSVKILADEFTNRHLILTGQERMSVKNLTKMIAEMIPGQVKVSFGKKEFYGHYEMTPYSFHPKVGHKLVSNDFVDLGQGLLDCLVEINARIQGNKIEMVDDNLVIETSPPKK